MSVPDEVRIKYIAIIDEILADADLTTISAKAVRKGIQTQVEFDITPHKTAINELIGGRFDVADAKQKARARLNGAENPLPSVETPDARASPPQKSHPAPRANGVHKSSEESAASPSSASSSPVKREADDEDLSDVIDDAPPKKKRKAGEADDAAIAARLQAEEDRKARPTRGGGTSRKSAGTKKKKKSPQKKSKDRIGSGEDSDVNGEDKPKKPKSNTGFHKPMNLSPQLSALLGGQSQLSRPQVTSQLWAHIKAHNLQDPTDKRHILCDDPMKDVLKTDRVHMFQMTKLVNQHLFNPDETV